MSLQHFKKQLRTHQTDAESVLWYHLRAKRFCHIKFRRQVQIKQYIVDFICHEQQLIIELDGGQHNDILVKEKDTIRTHLLINEGFNVIRFWNHEVLQELDAVLDKIYAILSNPSPAQARPLPQGER